MKKRNKIWIFPVALGCFFMFFSGKKTSGQDYQISFAGTGASSTVDSVKVENLTQCTSKTINGGNILHLTATVGINKLNTGTDNTISIYPNPVTGNCFVDFEAADQGKTIIGLYNIAGKEISMVQELLTKGHHTYQIRGISSGIYIIKITSAQYSYITKIVSSNATTGIAEIKHTETAPGMVQQNASSNIKNTKSMKGEKSIQMQYNIGDRLKLTGFSGNIYRTINMLIPTQNQTVTFTFVACTDADGNNYSVVKIGDQLWMAENLKTTKYRNNNPIPNETNNWNTISTGGYCYYNNDANNIIIYGMLYNWYAVNDSRNIAPIGWRVPADYEWTTLTDYLGGENVAGGKLKAICTTLWNNPNTGATDGTGFTALSGGYRDKDGAFCLIGNFGNFWSSTELDTYNALFQYLHYQLNQVNTASYPKKYGFSVRCVKDI